jgi:class 3 adenylate cyclase
MEPEDLAFCINTYLHKMAETAIEFGGTLDKFMGDGIMIFFGDPETKGVKDDALACIAMAKRMQEIIDDLEKIFAEQGIDKELHARFGIHTGYCNVGNFGSEKRMDYTLLGRSVNLASRLESNGIPDQIHISSETHALVKNDYQCMEREEPINVKGFDRALQTYFVQDKID